MKYYLEKIMTLVETKIRVDLEILAEMIKNLSSAELETLELIVTGESEEILKRYNQYKKGKVKPLSHSEVFGDV
jgi:hypothetical protein